MPKSKKVKPISFRVYPEGRFLYADVNIWPTKKAMQEHVKLPGRNYEASCGGREMYLVPPKGKGRTRKTGLFAEANFHDRAIGVEVVSHEFTHAAFAFADRRKLNLSDVVAKTWSQEGRKSTLDLNSHEERFCYALGTMVRQFTQKCYDIGLYGDLVKSKT